MGILKTGVKTTNFRRFVENLFKGKDWNMKLLQSAVTLAGKFTGRWTAEPLRTVSGNVYYGEIRDKHERKTQNSRDTLHKASRLLESRIRIFPYFTVSILWSGNATPG